MMEKVRRIDKQSFRELLNGFGLTEEKIVANLNDKATFEQFIETVGKAYEYGYELENDAKFAPIGIFSRAKLFCVDKIDFSESNFHFPEIYYTSLVTPL